MSAVVKQLHGVHRQIKAKRSGSDKNKKKSSGNGTQESREAPHCFSHKKGNDAAMAQVKAKKSGSDNLTRTVTTGNKPSSDFDKQESREGLHCFFMEKEISHCADY